MSVLFGFMLGFLIGGSVMVLLYYAINAWIDWLDKR